MLPHETKISNKTISAGEFSVEEIFTAVRGYESHLIDQVYLQSDEIKFFMENGTTCHICGKKGNTFSLIRHENDDKYHLALFSKLGERYSLIRQARIIHKKYGGPNHPMNLAPFCSDCTSVRLPRREESLAVLTKMYKAGYESGHNIRLPNLERSDVPGNLPGSFREPPTAAERSSTMRADLQKRWDREITSKNKRSLRFYSPEEIFTLMDALSDESTVIPEPLHRKCFRGANLRLYKRKGVTCSSCNTVGNTFSLEQVFRKDEDLPHLTLYARSGDKFVLFTKDHIIPRSFGGPNIQSNYRVMCQPCNQARGNKTPTREDILTIIAEMGKITPTLFNKIADMRILTSDDVLMLRASGVITDTAAF